jgi:Tfp pilus assembly protein PilF
MNRCRKWVWVTWVCLCAIPATAARGEATPGPSLVDVAGTVEVRRTGDAWQPVRAGEPLRIGDTLRTGRASRATVQLTDRSILRLDERTTLQLVPTRIPSALQRFRLALGRLLFFHREQPGAVEFETPVMTGAIRGTEFALDMRDDQSAVLDLLDGVVELAEGTNRLEVTGRESITWRPGRTPERAPLSLAAAVQWVVRSPQVLVTEDLDWATNEASLWREALTAYRAGDIPEALTRAPEPAPGDSDAAKTFRAALALGIGQTGEASRWLAQAGDGPGARALRRLWALAGGDAATTPPPATASEWLAQSYEHQAQGDLRGARQAARQALQRAPAAGITALRVAELEFMLEDTEAARRALDQGRSLAPRHPAGPALSGWWRLARSRPDEALAEFDEALRRDGAFGDAWLGRGLALEALHRLDEARVAFQIAATVEPRRSLARSYLGKAWIAEADSARAAKDLVRAQALDPGDPTPWLYSGLLRRQERDVNEAVRHLQHALELNDRRAVLRSRLGLDRDRAVSGASLALAYDDVGLPEYAEALASRAVTDDFSNFAPHLFLAQSLAVREDARRADLRLETPRLSELLLANLLAPVGAGNLSAQFAQQDYQRFFNLPQLAVSSWTTYRSEGDWSQAASVYGSLPDLDYALDWNWRGRAGEQPNADFDRKGISLALKQRVGDQDHVYFQAGWARQESGDVARRWDPNTTTPGFRVDNEQAPLLVAGWSRRWSPAHHTLAVVSYAEDTLTLADPTRRLPFVQQSGGTITGIDSTRAVYGLDLDSRYRFGGAELQHLWQSEHVGLIAGVRYQRGAVRQEAKLAGPLPPPVVDQESGADFERAGGYALGQWRPVNWLRLDAGIGYESVLHPANADLPPFSDRESSRASVTPRAGLTLTPPSGPMIQAAYGRSLGGLFFDQSVRLEPTRLAGFNQAFRSLITESVAGLVPGTLFDSAGVRLDHALSTGTHFGAALEWLRSDGQREVGAVSNSLPLPLPDTAVAIRQELDFQERSASVYLQQLVGRHASLGARYRASRAALLTRAPDLGRTVPGLGALEQDTSATLHQVLLAARWQHHRGWLARWESSWWRQDNAGAADPRPPDDDFWQHSVVVGYRWPRRQAEIQTGILNLFDQDYRLNPLNLAPELPRERTWFVSLRLNF